MLVRIPMPEEDERAAFFRNRLPQFPDWPLLAKLTEGLSLSAHQALEESLALQLDGKDAEAKKVLADLAAKGVPLP